ncbi:MAG: aldehyde dehydrogenase family protein [Stellaceae bacterium]
MTATTRGALLRRLGDLMAENAEALAATEVRDNGKLIAEMLGQTRYVPQWYYYYGGLADKIEGGVIPIDKTGVFNYTRWEPLGVVAAIVPWNSARLLRRAPPGKRGGPGRETGPSASPARLRRWRRRAPRATGTGIA